MSKKTEAKIPSVINENKNLAAVVSKLNTDDRTSAPKQLKTANLPDISESIKDKITNNETIVRLFPDIELSIQIMVSSILSPNDMSSTSIIYGIDGLELPTDVKVGLLENIKSYVSNNYKMEDKLSTIIREALFTKGAYIETIIPESSVDAMINGTGEVTSLEAFVNDNLDTSKLKILGDDEKSVATFSLEDMDLSLSKNENVKSTISVEISDEDLGIDITDNYSILAATSKMSKIVTNKISTEMYKEDTVTDDDDDFFNKLFKPTTVNNKSGSVTVLTEDETNRESIGMPLTMKLPVESTIPVYVSGDVTNHLGYFVLLDDKGVPITNSSDFTVSNDDFKNNSEIKAKSIIDKASTAINGYSKAVPKVENIEEIYSYVVNQKLKNKLKNGLLGDLADFSKDNSEIYRTMLSRVLSKQKTKILFVPKELVAFYAFKFRDNGTGESLLETISVLSSIRAILLFSRIMANIKNSVTTTEVSATLDENDLDPSKTMDKIVSEVMRSRSTQMPIGVTRVEDLVDWTKKVGYKFNFKHDSLPDMDITTSEENTSKVVPDSDLDEEIRKQILMSFSLPPKAVEDGYDSDFATTIVQNNVLFTKRVMVHQDILAPLVANHIKIILKNDMIIFNEIKDTISKNITAIIRELKKEKNDLVSSKDIDKDKLTIWLTNAYIDKITISFPRIEEHETDNMKESFDNYKDSLDDYIETFFSTDALPDELAGQLVDKMDDFKLAIQNSLLRKWMSDNNYLPELLNATTVDKDGKPIYDVLGEYETYLKTLSEIIVPFMKQNNDDVEKIDAKVDKAEGNDEEEEDDSYDDDNASDDETESTDVDDDNSDGSDDAENADDSNTDDGDPTDDLEPDSGDTDGDTDDSETDDGTEPPEPSFD